MGCDANRAALRCVGVLVWWVHGVNPHVCNVVVPVSARQEWPRVRQQYSAMVKVSQNISLFQTTTTRHFPLADLTLCGDPPSDHRQAIFDAYQYMSMLYQLSDTESPVNVRICTNSTPPANQGVVGQWTTAQIDLFLDRIPSPDLTFTVTLHELFHHLGFNTIDYGNNGSFRDKTDPVTKVYYGQKVVFIAQVLIVGAGCFPCQLRVTCPAAGQRHCRAGNPENR